jgi:hypothetical protein
VKTAYYKKKISKEDYDKTKAIIETIISAVETGNRSINTTQDEIKRKK